MELCNRIILGGLVLLAFTLPFVYHTATWLTLGISISFMAWVIKIAIFPSERNLWTPLNFSILLLGIVTVITTIFSVSPKFSFHYFKRDFLMRMFLYFIVVYNIKEKKQMRYIIWGILLANFIVNLQIFWEYFSFARRYGWYYRPMGTYGSTTRQAMYFVFIIPLLFSLFLNAKSRLEKWYLGIPLIFSVFSLLVSFTRGAWISVFLSLVILSLRKSKKIVLAVVLSILIVFIISPQARSRISTLWKPKNMNTFSSGRVNLWENTIPIIKDHLWIGAGYSSDIFNVLADKYNLTDFKKRPKEEEIAKINQQPDAHNLYLQLMVETGIVGLSVFLFLLVCFFRRGIQGLRKMKEGWDKEFLFGLIVSLGAILFYGLVGYFYEDRNGLFFWLYIGMSMAIVRNLETSKYHSDKG